MSYQKEPLTQLEKVPNIPWFCAHRLKVGSDEKVVLALSECSITQMAVQRVWNVPIKLIGGS